MTQPDGRAGGGRHQFGSAAEHPLECVDHPGVSDAVADQRVHPLSAVDTSRREALHLRRARSAVTLSVLMDRGRVDLWIFGHTHRARDLVAAWNARRQQTARLPGPATPRLDPTV